MSTKTLAAAILGFLLGGFVVSVAATLGYSDETGGAETTMTAMTDELRDKDGDEYDALFLAHMIEHHQAALDMAELSEERAGHTEVKELSEEVIAAQQREIARMRDWQERWGYDDTASDEEHDAH
jgi:uncharacterized protein (DUF305 family)